MSAIGKVQSMIQGERSIDQLDEHNVAVTIYRHSVHFQYNHKPWMLENLDKHSDGHLEWNINQSGDVLFMRTKTSVEIADGVNIKVDITFCVNTPKDEQ